MKALDLTHEFRDLSTPLLADACLKLGFAARVAPTGLGPVRPDSRLAGRVRPVRHYGSVDVFLEAMELCSPAEVLVIDNQGRRDEGCIGDLTVLEARAAGLAGILVWGTNRDSREIMEIGFPVFSYGSCPSGPNRLDPMEEDALVTARFGEFQVDNKDVVFADSDGALFVPENMVDEVLVHAASILEVEREQIGKLQAGSTLRKQFRFSDYLSKRAADPEYSFRKHLRA